MDFLAQQVDHRWMKWIFSILKRDSNNQEITPQNHNMLLTFVVLSREYSY